MDLKDLWENNVIISENIESSLIANKSCPECKNINIKKFKPLDSQFNLDTIDNDFGRCVCGKRHVDAVMAHVLKVMVDLEINMNKLTLRNGPVPLITPFYVSNTPPYLKKNSLILLHPLLSKKVAKEIFRNITEIKGVLKGNPNDTVGIKKLNSVPTVYELMIGCDTRCDIIRTPLGEIAINKIQHLSYLEFPKSIENKVMILNEYLKSKNLTNEDISNLKVLDGTCGNGTLGIYLLKYGVKKVVFNDIWKPATISTSINLKANGFRVNFLKAMDNHKIATGSNFEVYNLAIEYLNKKLYDNEENEFDICILDCFPGVNTSNLEKAVRNIANDTLII